jgi:hypothetical protein
MKKNIACLKGKTINQRSDIYDTINIEKDEDKNITLEIDIISIEDQHFLISLTRPLDLLTIDHMKYSSKTKDNIKVHLFNHINVISGEGFLVNEVKSNAESSFVAMKNDLNRIGVKLTIGTPGNKNTTILALDRRIKTLKERIRCILHDLDYHLPQILLKECVAYVIQRMNLIRSSPFTMLSPRERYTGIKTDVNRDIRLVFGTIVQVPVSTISNNMDKRTNTCISLTPIMNNNGSIKFYVLKNDETIIRDSWTQIPVT